MGNRTVTNVSCTGRLQASVASCAFVLLFVSANVAQQASTKISGVVADVNGAVVRDAAVEFDLDGGASVRTRTDESGRFSLIASSGDGMLVVQAAGFNLVRMKINQAAANRALEIRLEPATIIDRILVTADDDERIPATPASQFALSQREIDLSGALTLDDVLRQVPGFTLFRRAGGLTANPTTQGVSLRGVGANGASRALVMYDGVPLNSPFGGWVYWNRVPRSAVESVTVFNGGTSDLYGSGALGGVLNVSSRAAEPDFLDFEFSGGSEATGAASLSGAKVWRDFAVGLDLQALHTDGYILVPENQRGAVDTRAGTSDLSGSLTLSRKLRGEGRAFLRVGSFGESRRNGTPLQVNDTRLTSVDLGLDLAEFSLRAYGSREIFNQNFSAVAIDRNSETLTNRQRNPSQQIGFAFQWRRNLGDHHSISAGAEGRDVRGHSAETFVDAGGRQRSLGFFGNDSIRVGSWSFGIGGRIDTWRNYDGFSNRTAAATRFADRSETAFSPRLSVVKQFEGGLSASASFYRAFRAPTLNELYRNFRVGNVVTNANAMLGAERLTGGEAGLGIQQFGDRLFVRGNFFWSDIDDSIANVTLATTPALITRQRQNLGAIRARGFEVSAVAKPSRHWEFAGEYLLTDSTVLRFPANKKLEGLFVPQVPRNQLNLQLSYSNRGWTAATQARFIGKQFDDDLNTLPLRSYFTADAQISRAVSERVKLFVAVQNLTGVRYQISSTPVFTVGPPVLVRVGIQTSLRD
jgi:outer membrane receptor protein involved in Fe transport